MKKEESMGVGRENVFRNKKEEEQEQQERLQNDGKEREDVMKRGSGTCCSSASIRFKRTSAETVSASSRGLFLEGTGKKE